MPSREIPQVGPNLTHLLSTTSLGQLAIRFSRKKSRQFLWVSGPSAQRAVMETLTKIDTRKIKSTLEA